MSLPPLTAATRLPAADLPLTTPCVECGHPKASHAQRLQLQVDGTSKPVVLERPDLYPKGEVLVTSTYCGHVETINSFPRCPCPGFR